MKFLEIYQIHSSPAFLNSPDSENEGAAEFPPHPPSAAPERESPAVLPEYLEGRTPHTLFAFPFLNTPAEKILESGKKCVRGCRRVREAAGGGALVRSAILDKMSSSRVVKTHKIFKKIS